MEKTSFLGVLLIVVALMSSCVSAPIHYYTLMSSKPQSQLHPAVMPFVIDVLPVYVPEALDRPQFVVRNGLNGVLLLDNQQWSSNLGEELTESLSDQLSAYWQVPSSRGLADAASKRLLRVNIEVRRLDIWTDEKIVLVADWTVGFKDTSSIRLICRSQLHKPLGRGYQAIAIGMQETLAELAKVIAGTVDENGLLQCPSAFAS
ncbi:PqiC family protein [Gynuella sp.]|uniref:PqiC family protein n=1 Tax=Gynuella sp. TaxID=2969146 RepID=UPI003D12C238